MYGGSAALFCRLTRCPCTFTRVQGLFRRGTALHKLGDWDAAKIDMHKLIEVCFCPLHTLCKEGVGRLHVMFALTPAFLSSSQQIEPSNKSASNTLKTIVAEEAAYKKREKARYGKMFA